MPAVPLLSSNITTTETLWPGRPRPNEDELLSSWLGRLSAANGLKLHTFTAQAWPGLSVWNRDIDGLAPEAVLIVCAQRAGVPIERVRETTLGAFTGAVFEHHQPRGLTPWILPVGIYHRERRRHGNQCCPECLDESPYFRRSWRLAFSTVCTTHRVPLIDRCPSCAEPIAFHRGDLGDRTAFDASPLTRCHACRRDFRKRVSRRAAVNAKTVDFQARLELAARSGRAEVNGSQLYAHLFFLGLRIVVRVCGSARYGRYVQAELAPRAGIEARAPDWLNENCALENLSINDRRRLLTFASLLLEDWPKTFLTVLGRVGVRGSDVCGHDRIVPYWIASVVREGLNGKRHVPSIAEISSVVEYLRRKGEVPTRESVGHYVGSAWYRKRSLEYLLQAR